MTAPRTSQGHLTLPQKYNREEKGEEKDVRNLYCFGAIGFAAAGSDVFEACWMMIDRPFAIHQVVVRAIEKYGG